MIKAKYPGRFVTIEGPDASGKSTSIEQLKKYLNMNPKDIANHRMRDIVEKIQQRFDGILFLREPGGTPVNDEIRNIILSPHKEPLYSRTQVFLFAANRYQNIRQIITPALRANKLVICDRFLLSTLVYQTRLEYSSKKEQLRQINELLDIHKFALEDVTAYDPDTNTHEYITPDTTILFNVSKETIKQRMLTRRNNNETDMDVNDDAILKDVHRINKLRTRYHIIDDLGKSNESPWLNDIYQINADVEKDDRLNQIFELLNKTLYL